MIKHSIAGFSRSYSKLSSVSGVEIDITKEQNNDQLGQKIVLHSKQLQAKYEYQSTLLSYSKEAPICKRF